MQLTSNNVEETFFKCLYTQDELTNGTPSDFIVGDGIMNKVGFNPTRLKELTPEIESMLEQLPDLKEGISFLNLCVDKSGVQWTDFHQRMDQLVTLGLAIGKLTYLMPRQLWQALPGGMPYIGLKK